MMRPLLVLAGAIALLSPASSPASAPVPSQDRLYVLSYDLFDGDQKIGSPRMIVANDRPETVVVEGPRGYTLRATLVAGGDAMRHVAVLSSEISLPGEGGLVKIAAPIMAVPLGQSTRFEIARKDRPGAGPFRMDVTVTE